MKAIACLCAAALLAACASTEEGPRGAPSDRTTAAGAADGKAAGEAADPALPEEGRSALYRRIETLAGTWQIAAASPGEGAKSDAWAAQTAIAREVLKDMDAVLSDVERSENPRWRISAAKGLGFVEEPRARPALERVLGASDASLLSAALVSLARIASADTDDRPVAELLRFPDPVVRGNAALCLARVFQSRRNQKLQLLPSGRIDSVEADLSVLLFEKDDSIVRGNACQALGGLGTPGAEDALLNRLRDETAFVRLKAAQGLGLSGTARSRSPLLEALGREPEENVKVLMALALGAVLEREGRKPPHAELGTDAARWRAWIDR